MKKNKQSPNLWLTMLSLVLSVGTSTTLDNRRPPRAGILIGDNTIHSQYPQFGGRTTASTR